LAESRLLATIKRDLLTDEAVSESKRRLRRAMTRPDPNAQGRKRLEAEVQHIMDAIAKGLLSSALARRLQEAESALATLPAATVTRMDDALRAFPQAVERLSADGCKAGRSARRYRPRAKRAARFARRDSS